MKEKSIHRAKLNISTTLLGQIIATVCGIAVPKIMIETFGSAVYGTTTSIAKFLSYISLLESGIGRVARAELYKPLAERNEHEISRVYHAVKRFFRTVGIAFVAYTLVLSFTYYDIAQVSDLSRTTIFLLVWVISTTTLAQYLGGLANLTLLNADQRQYLGNTVVSVTTVLNALLVFLLTRFDSDILIVKLGSSLVYIAQPLCYAIFVRKLFKLPSVGKDRTALKQKWTGIGQHLAYFIHTNTDIVMLTLFADIRLVAVYSVYSMVISSIRKIALSCTGGMEAAFGEMIAKEEKNELRSAFHHYKFLLSFVTILLFGVTAAMIVPFVRLYTKEVTDANYIQPIFAIVLLFAEMLDCFMFPCSSLPVSANKLKETRLGSYAEAIINIALSLALIRWNPLVGVAIGTLLATLFKGMYYMRYSAKNILEMKLGEPLKYFFFTVASVGVFAIGGYFLGNSSLIENFYVWIAWAAAAFAVVFLLTLVFSRLLFPIEFRNMLSLLKRKVRR